MSAKLKCEARIYQADVAQVAAFTYGLCAHFSIYQAQHKQNKPKPVEMPLLRMTSSILKATMDSPTALNMVSKSLSANFVASIHPHQQHQPKREQLKDRRVSEPTRCVQLKQTVRP